MNPVRKNRKQILRHIVLPECRSVPDEDENRNCEGEEGQENGTWSEGEQRENHFPAKSEKEAIWSIISQREKN